MLKVSDLLTVEDLVGFKFVDSEATAPNEVDAVVIQNLVERSPYNFHRIMYPHTIVTMDLRTDRINIHINEKSNIIERVAAG